MSMSKAEAASFKSICNTIVKGMGDVTKQLRGRIGRLEAENKELRSLWEENEKGLIELTVRVNRVYEAAGILSGDTGSCEHYGCRKLAQKPNNSDERKDDEA